MVLCTSCVQSIASQSNLLRRLLALAVGGVLGLVIAVHRYIEQVAVRVHGAVLRIGPRRGPRRHRLLELLEPRLDVGEVVDLEAEMIDAARRRLAAIAQDS